MSRRESKSRIPDVDPKSPEGVQVMDAVQGKLRQYLGADYVDRSLAQYVVVMLAHKTEQAALGDNLVEFLGPVDAKELASWLFECLESLLQPPQQQQQPQQHQRQRRQQRPATAGTQGTQAATQDMVDVKAEDELELEVEAGSGSGSGSGSEGEGASDADTAEAAPAGHRRHSSDDVQGERGRSSGRRLQSAVVVDEYRRHDAGRSRSRSPGPRRSYSPPRGRRHSPPRRRRSPPPLEPFSYQGASGSRYFGHNPYPYRAGGGLPWRGERLSPPRRRSPSPPPYGHGGRVRGGWGPPPPLGAHMDDPRWHERGSGHAVFDRLAAGGGYRAGPPPSLHYEHDRRWGNDEQRRHSGGDGRGGMGPPPGLAHGMPHPGRGGQGIPYDARMGQEHVAQQQEQQGQQAQQAGPAQLPWERPSYMDLELQRQQQQQAQQQQLGVAPAAAPAAAAAAGMDPAAAGAFARALAQAAASLGSDGRSAALLRSAGSGQQPSFQVTITQGGQGAEDRRLTAPLLQHPDLQQVLRQRLRAMELQLVQLRAEQAERTLADVHRRHELSTAAKLDLTVRSVCVKGVHPAAAERVLIAHFGACGYIQRITFLREPASGRKTGVAYLQFSSAAEAQAALALDGSALLQRVIQVVPSDSPAARVAATRALRASFPPPGLVPVPLFAAPMPPPRDHGRRSMHYSRSGGRGGRGHAAFKYVRPADEPAAGSPLTAAGAAAAAAPAAAAAAGPDGDHMAE